MHNFTYASKIFCEGNECYIHLTGGYEMSEILLSMLNI